MRFLLLILALSHLTIVAQVTTSDIPRWYKMIDNLAAVTTKNDSLAVIRRDYLDKATPGLKIFAESRNIKAKTILQVMRNYPKYYASIRKDALRIDIQRDSIQAALERVKQVVPSFKIPPVTIAFGIMNSGGTADKGYILLGAGMNLARASSEVSELSRWHIENIIPKTDATPDLRSMIAHEAIHTRQSVLDGKAGLAEQVLYEGVCDFIVYDLLDLGDNAPHHNYGEANECEVWEDFVHDLNSKKPRKRLIRWLYGGTIEKSGRPADLGYFVGRRLAEDYYQRAANKKQALQDLMNADMYTKITQSRTYDGGCTAP